jgi:hypothetical protein
MKGCSWLDFPFPCSPLQRQRSCSIRSDREDIIRAVGGPWKQSKNLWLIAFHSGDP